MVLCIVASHGKVFCAVVLCHRGFKTRHARRKRCLLVVFPTPIKGKKGKVPLFILDNPISYISCSP